MCAETYGRHGDAHGRQNLLNVTHTGSQTFVCSPPPTGECVFCHESSAEKDYRELESGPAVLPYSPLGHSAETFSYREAIRAREHDVVMREVVDTHPVIKHRVLVVSRLTILVVYGLSRGVKVVFKGGYTKIFGKKKLPVPLHEFSTCA